MVVVVALNRLTVVCVDAMVGVPDPFMLKAVALASVTVALLIVVVPVAAPIPMDVAAPNAETPVAVVLNSVTVPVDVVANVGFAPL